MIEWLETVLVPKMETVKVLSDNPQDIDKCWNCMKGNCEKCDDLTPITCEFTTKQVKMRQVTLCGIPVGYPYQVDD